MGYTLGCGSKKLAIPNRRPLLSLILGLIIRSELKVWFPKWVEYFTKVRTDKIWQKNGAMSTKI